MHHVDKTLSPRAVVESLVNGPHARSCLLSQRRIRHVEQRAPSAWVTQFDPTRVDVWTVVAYASIKRLLPLRCEGNSSRRRAMHVVNKGDFVGRQGTHKVDGLVWEEHWEGRMRETQMIEGVGHFGIQARRRE